MITRHTLIAIFLGTTWLACDVSPGLDVADQALTGPIAAEADDDAPPPRPVTVFYWADGGIPPLPPKPTCNETIATYKTNLGSDDFLEREMASSCLMAALSPDLATELRPLLQNPSPEVVRRAADILRGVGKRYDLVTNGRATVSAGNTTYFDLEFLIKQRRCDAADPTTINVSAVPNLVSRLSPGLRVDAVGAPPAATTRFWDNGTRATEVEAFCNRFYSVIEPLAAVNAMADFGCGCAGATAGDGSIPTSVLTVHTNRLKDYLEWPAPLKTSTCVAACARQGRTALSSRQARWLSVPETTSGTEVPAEFDPPTNFAQPKWSFTKVRFTSAPDVVTHTLYIDYLLRALPGAISVDIGTPQNPTLFASNIDLMNVDHIDNAGKPYIPRGTVVAITLKNGSMDAGPPIMSVGMTPAICTVGLNDGKTTCTLQLVGFARVQLAAVLPPGTGGDGYGG